MNKYFCKKIGSRELTISGITVFVVLLALFSEAHFAYADLAWLEQPVANSVYTSGFGGSVVQTFSPSVDNQILDIGFSLGEQTGHECSGNQPVSVVNAILWEIPSATHASQGTFLAQAFARDPNDPPVTYPLLGTLSGSLPVGSVSFLRMNFINPSVTLYAGHFYSLEFNLQCWATTAANFSNYLLAGYANTNPISSGQMQTTTGGGMRTNRAGDDLNFAIRGELKPVITNLHQVKFDGVAILEGTIAGDSKIIFKADLADPDGDLVKLQVDLKKATEVFDGTDFLLESNFISSGNDASVIATNLKEGEYHWRARTMDSTGSVSDWQEFGQSGNTDFTVRFPVIILPGILGSWTKDNNFQLFTNPHPVPQSSLVLTEESEAWFLEQFDRLGDIPHSWADLKLRLLQENYQVYKCPYDWRFKHEQIAQNYLIPCIDKAKAETGASKVNIVAHSMGGLVTRSYIQGDSYRSDIGKFAMLGTPNHGSANAYYSWEAGDMLGDFGILGKTFEKTVIDQLLHLSPKRLLMSKIDYVHTFFPSVRQLLPTFDYLKDQFFNLRSVTSHTWQNDLLPDLNSEMTMERLRDNVDTKIFASEGMGTLDIINVIYRNPFNFFAIPALPYPDGQPSLLPEEYSTFGDGTVLSRSAQLPEAFIPLKIKTRSSADPKEFLSHANLPNAFFNEVSEFLGTPSNVTDLYSPDLPKEILAISLASPADLLIIDPNGKKLGFDTSTQTEMYEITNGVYSGRDEFELVAIVDPMPGKYQVQIVGNGSGGEIHTGISYAKEECQGNVNQDNIGQISPGQTFNFTLDFTSSCEPVAVTYSLDAIVQIKPEMLKLSDKEKHITAFIQLPQPYNIKDIDVNSIRLNNQILGLKYKFINRDKTEPTVLDGPGTLRVKFNKAKASDILSLGNNTLTVSGNLKDGTRFAGSAAIQIKK